MNDMRFGFIGLGDMGAPMAMRLVDSGAAPVVWNRTAARLAPLAHAGARVAASPREVMHASDVVGLCLTSHAAVEEVCAGPAGLFAGRNPQRAGQTIVDFSTGAPEAAKALAARAAAHGMQWVDAPVSGGVPAAAAGRLAIFAGGSAGAVAAARPMLELLSANLSHMGESGSGQAMKLCNQLIVSCNVLAIAEAIALARKAGVDVARLPAALQGGFADSAPLQVFGPRMAAHVHEPRLGSTALMHKDVRLIEALAGGIGAATPLLGLVSQLLAQATQAPDIGSEADLSRVVRLFEPEQKQTQTQEMAA